MAERESPYDRAHRHSGTGVCWVRPLDWRGARLAFVGAITGWNRSPKGATDGALHGSRGFYCGGPIAGGAARASGSAGVPSTQRSTTWRSCWRAWSELWLLTWAAPSADHRSRGKPCSTRRSARRFLRGHSHSGQGAGRSGTGGERNLFSRRGVALYRRPDLAALSSFGRVGKAGGSGFAAMGSKTLDLDSARTMS